MQIHARSNRDKNFNTYVTTEKTIGRSGTASSLPLAASQAGAYAYMSVCVYACDLIEQKTNFLDGLRSTGGDCVIALY